MKRSHQAIDLQSECERLKRIVDRDGGMESLSPTESAFLRTVCTSEDEDTSAPENIVFTPIPTIDNSGGSLGGTIMDDPDAGRPDDPDDANPAVPDPAITKT